MAIVRGVIVENIHLASSELTGALEWAATLSACLLKAIANILPGYCLPLPDHCIGPRRFPVLPAGCAREIISYQIIITIRSFETLRIRHQ